MRNEAHTNADLREGYEHAIRERNADLANLREDLQHALQVHTHGHLADWDTRVCSLPLQVLWAKGMWGWGGGRHVSS